MMRRLLALFRLRPVVQPIAADADGTLRLRPHARLPGPFARHRGKGRPLPPPSAAELAAAREANRLLGEHLDREDALRRQMSAAHGGLLGNPLQSATIVDILNGRRR